jgi:hypothetical protein
MKWTEVPNIDKFPFHIRQRQSYFCIPASIEVVTKYFRHESPVTQEYLWTQYALACRDRNVTLQNINFKTIKELVLDVDPNYSWAESQHIDRPELHDFDDLIRHIRHSIENGLPHIVSLPVGTFWHMFTVLGYDDLNLRIHDPNPYEKSPRDIPLEKMLLDLQTLANAGVTDSLVIKPKLQV